MRNFILLQLLISLTFFSVSAQVSESAHDKRKPLDSLVQEMSKEIGLITAYSEENKVFFELPDTLLGKDLLMVTRFVQLPSNYQAYLNAGSKTAQQMIHFIKQGKQILLTQLSDINIARDEDPIAISVAQNNFPPILAAFPIKNNETDRFLIDVSDYFKNDSPGFNIISKSIKKEYSIGGVDGKRSFIDYVHSYPLNTEIRHTLTFSVNDAPRGNTSNTMSFQINHSLIALPENPMPV